MLASFFLIPYRNSENMIQPIVPAGWTLWFEMFFYLLFAAALAWKIRPLRFLTPVLVALSAIGLLRQPGWPSITTLLDPILLEFLAGVWLGYAVRRALRLSVPVAAGLGVLGFVGIGILEYRGIPWLRPATWGVCALLIVLAAVALEPRVRHRIPAWLLRIGDASYSLYLVHVLVILAVARIYLQALIARPNLYGMAAVSLVLSVIVALGVYRWIERTLTLAAGRATGWGAPRSVRGIGEESIHAAG